MTDDITLSKTNADGRKYFSLFDKYIPAKLTKSSAVLLYSISNVDCIANIIEKNPNCMYYIYDSEDIYNAVCCFVECTHIYYIKDFEYITENDMKFDCIIMNPPYGSRKNSSVTLHYDITDTVLKALKDDGKCVSLMPITLIKSSHDGKKSIETKNLYDLYLKEIVEIDGNEVFDTSMKSIAIYDFEKNKNETDTINIKTFKKSEIVKSLFDFDYNISNNDKNILNKLTTNKSIAIDRRSYFRLYKKEKQNKTLLCDCVKKFILSDKVNTFKYFIPINFANGSMNAQWQSQKLKSYKLLKKDELYDILLNDYSSKAFLGFKENELQSAQNILKLIACNCLRYPLLKTQDDQNMCPRVYKYFPDIDYTNIDTEEKFYKHFNITPDEQKIIEETMAAYK